VLAEIGGLVARINGIQVDAEHDWSTAMAADLAARQADRDKILAGGFSARQFDRMLDLLEEYVRDFPCAQWVLCHGDLGPKHVFVTGDGRDGAAVRVSGIIDFGDWQPGAPVHDLAVLRFAARGWTCHRFSPATACRMTRRTGDSWTCTP
jgi:Ser/Thr protein kinase RdoA (MazF antagonist)